MPHTINSYDSAGPAGASSTCIGVGSAGTANTASTSLNQK
jgi:hypothetical protein